MRWVLIPHLAAASALFGACVGSDPANTPTTGDGGGIDAAGPLNDGAPGGDLDAAGDAGSLDAEPPCTPDLFCQPSNPCKKGMCNAAAKCEVSGDVAYGTACGTSEKTICKAGACEDTEWALWTMPSWVGAAVGPIPDYSFEQISGGVTTIDSVTGLTWLTTGPNVATWAEAKAHCDAFTMYGFPDWRLPTAIEVVSIGDVSRANGLAEKFSTVPNGSGLWSSSPVADTAGSHWSVSSLRVTSSLDTATFAVRCVR